MDFQGAVIAVNTPDSCADVIIKRAICYRGIVAALYTYSSPVGGSRISIEYTVGNVSVHPHAADTAAVCAGNGREIMQFVI